MRGREGGQREGGGGREELSLPACSSVFLIIFP